MSQCKDAPFPDLRVPGETQTARPPWQAGAPITRPDGGAPDDSSCDDFAWLADILPRPPARILDAGCGEGALSRALADAGYAVTSIDADPAAVAAARAAGVPAMCADLASYEDEPFDAVVMLLSLHHMHPLGTVLDQVTRLLRPSGTLILDEYAWDWAGQPEDPRRALPHRARAPGRRHPVRDWVPANRYQASFTLGGPAGCPGIPGIGLRYTQGGILPTR